MALKKRRVEPGFLRDLGVSEALIKASVRLEDRGVLDLRPTSGLVERTVKACRRLYPKPAEKEDPGWDFGPFCLPEVAFPWPLDAIQKTMAGGVSWAPIAVAAAGIGDVTTKQRERFEALRAELCEGSYDAFASKTRPAMICEDHMSTAPAWYVSNAGFRTLWIDANRIDATFTKKRLEPSSRVIVLRNRFEDYDESDILAFSKLLREARNDVFLVPRKRFGDEILDVTVTGNRVIQRSKQSASPWSAIENTKIKTSAKQAELMRNKIEAIMTDAAQVKDDGEFTWKFRAFAAGDGPEAVRGLFDKVNK